MLLALTLASLAACSDDAGMPGPGGGVPMADVCMLTGSGFIEFDLFCFPDEAGFDGVCTFNIESSNGAVVALQESVQTVAANSSRRVHITTLQAVNGRATITGINEDGSRFHVGTVQVGGC